MLYKRFSRQKGHTLLELLLALAIVATLAGILTTMASITLSYIKQAKQLENKNELIAIKDTLLALAQLNNKGVLPEYFSVKPTHCLDTSDSTNAHVLSDFSNTHINTINYDDSVLQHQRLCTLSNDRKMRYALPVGGFGGAKINIDYQVAQVMQTNCPKSEVCELSKVNKVNNTDFITLTTLPIQEQMWQETHQKLLTIRAKIMRHRIDLARTNNGGNTTNWHHKNTEFGERLSGNYASTNQGCFDGWYDLSKSENTILSEYGLNKNLYSKTAWGASIEFCRDFDLSTNAKRNTVPHLAALRINKDVSRGEAGSSLKRDNFFISF